MRHSMLLRRLLIGVIVAALLVPLFGMQTTVVSAAQTPAANWEMTVPRIYLDTAEGNGFELQKDDIWRDANITVTDVDGSSFTQDCLMKVRGNTTALSWVTKKSFSFKFDKKRDVLGMGKGKKWALIANAFDPTLLRNYIAFTIANELGLAYTSEFRFVDFWLDGTYRGCYMAMEPVEQGKDRVDIDIESNDGKKDFLLEYEKSREEEKETYLTTDGLRFIIQEPEDPDEEQQAYILDVMQNVIAAMKTKDRAQVEALVDVDSFARFYLLNEYLKTYDFDMSSVYFYYKDGKLYAGPPWDYDMSMGNSSPDFNSTQARTAHESADLFANNKNIYRYLWKNEWFVDEVKQLYHEYRAFFESVAADGGLLDTARAQYGDLFNRNYGQGGWNVAKWWINYQLKPQSTYEKNYLYLKTWGQERVAWMNDCYDPPNDTYLLGDANGDGKIDINDATAVQRELAELGAADELLPIRADIDGGGLSIDDATAIQRFLAELGAPAGIGEERTYT